MKAVDIEFVRRAGMVLASDVALGDKKQVRGATEALAKELGMAIPKI
jgi:hypothetical protein